VEACQQVLMDFGGGGGGPEQWFYNLPSVTRIWLGSTVIITALVNLDFIKWNDIDFTSFDDIIGHPAKRVEAWRYVYFCILCTTL